MARPRIPSLSSVLAVLSAAVIAVVAGGYTVYWFRLAEGMRTGVEAWASEQRARGYTVRFGELAVTGFPGLLRLRVTAPVLGRVSGAAPWRWAGPTLIAELAPWDLGRVVIRLAGVHRLDARLDGRLRRLRAEAVAAEVEVLMAQAGRVRAAALKASGVTAVIVETGQAVSIGVLDLVVRPHRPADLLGEGLPGDLELGFAVEDLVLPAAPDIPLGRRITRLTGQLGAHGRLPLDGTAAAAALWRDEGGRLDIRRLTLEWGRVWVTASGQAGLDEALQPRADLDGRLRGWNALIDALVRVKRMGRTKATLASLVLTALARPAEDGGPPVLSAKIGLRDRRLYIGPVPILKLAPVNWR